MKKLLLFTLLALIFESAYGQRQAAWDSIRVPDGADTIVYKRMFDESNFSITFEFDDFDDIDAIVDLGSTPPGLTFALRNTPNEEYFNRFNIIELPFTLSDTAASSQAFSKDVQNFKFLSIKLTKGSVTAGLYLRYYLTVW